MQTPLANRFLDSRINSFYPLGGKVAVNASVTIEEIGSEKLSQLKKDVQKLLYVAIQQNGNLIGSSSLSIDGPLHPILGVQGLCSWCTSKAVVVLLLLRVEEILSDDL